MKKRSYNKRKFEPKIKRSSSSKTSLKHKNKKIVSLKLTRSLFFLEVKYDFRYNSYGCRSGLLGQTFALSGSETHSLHDEDHSARRVHSLPGLCQVRSGMSPEGMWSCLEIAGSERTHQVGRERLKLNSSDSFFSLYPYFLQRHEWYNPLVIFVFCLGMLPECSTQISLLGAANFRLVPSVVIFYGKNNQQYLKTETINFLINSWETTIWE